MSSRTAQRTRKQACASIGKHVKCLVLAVTSSLILLGWVGSGRGQPSSVHREVITLADGTQILQVSSISQCANYRYERYECFANCGSCGDVQTASVGGGSRVTSSGEAAPDRDYCAIVGSESISCPGSVVDPTTLNYHHYVDDYQPGGGGASCGDCGPSAPQGGLPGLFIQRRHRFRDMTWQSSFGPGVYSNYDTKLVVYKVGTGAQLDLFDLREKDPKRLYDGLLGDTKDGIFHNVKSRALKEVRLLDGGGNLTSDLSAAVKAVATNYHGGKHEFALIDMSAQEEELRGHWKLDEGTGTSAADSSGNAITGTLTGGPAWVTGKVGSNALQFDGANDYVALGNPAELAFEGPITIAAWIKPDATSGLRNIVAHGYATGPNGEVFLRINSGQYQVGAWNGSNFLASSTIPGGDVGNWVHLAGTYDGERWRLYRNGIEVALSSVNTGAVQVAGNWAIGARGTGTERFFDGTIDDVRISKGVLSEGAIAALAGITPPSTLISGRLTKIEDRNGYKVDLAYKTWTAGQIAESPERQWQIDTVTDANGRQATFTYKAAQESGRWVVEKIDLPNGKKIEYEYVAGKLDKVKHADGTQSTFAYGVDSATQTTTIEFDDAAADPGSRKKKVYLTNNIILVGLGGGSDNGDFNRLLNQSSLLIRMVVNAEDEVTYLGFHNPHHYFGLEMAVYEGAGRLKVVGGASFSQFYEDGWTLDDPSLGYDGINGTRESNFAAIQFTTHDDLEKGVLAGLRDTRNRSYTYAYDGDSFMTKKTYSDSTTEEWAYNGFKQVTRYKDRLNRVTKYEYDSRGNRTKMQVGIRFVSGTGDVNQSEFAEYKWEYYPSGHANEFLLRYEYEAVATAGGSTNDRKEYLYNSDDLLEEIKESDDTGTGYHMAAKYTYENAGGTARRLKTSKDALGRITTYFYDERDRVVMVQYHDDSTERTAYGNDADGTENLVVATQDRNGNVTSLEYDDTGRLTRRILASHKIPLADVVDTTKTDLSALLAGNEIADVNLRAEYTYSYLDGTKLRKEWMHRGERNTYKYDYRHRTVQTISQPRAGTTLTSTSTYINNLLFSSEDPYGRKSFNAYRSSDSALIRSVQATVPDPTGEPASFSDVLNLIRAGTPYTPAPNAEYLITDHELDAEGQQFATIDPRGVVHASEYDSRGRTVKSVEAATVLASYSPANFTPTINLSTLLSIAARTETDYDARSNVEEVRHPRYFDATDSEGQNKCKTTMTYTPRNLLKERTVAAGAAAYVAGDPAKVKISESFAYTNDGRRVRRIDFRGEEWHRAWHACCGRFQGAVDPLAVVDDSGSNKRAGALSNTDYYGNITHTALVKSLPLPSLSTGLISGYSAHDPTDADTLTEMTTRYDARHRRVAQTVWLVPRGNVDPNDVPIAGGGASGDPALVVSGVKQGLTTRWLYDENLTDGVGLDSAAGVSLPKLDGSGNFIVSIKELLDELYDDLGGGSSIFAAGSDGRAVAAIDPEEEISVIISDGAGRAVCSGVIASYKSATFAANAPITWSTVRHDATAVVDQFGLTLQTTAIDALDHTSKSRSDGAGRTLETEDAEGRLSTASYDGNSNVRSVRDPNGTGQDCTYDERNRDISCTDTQGDTTYTVYNKHNRVIQTIDAKGKSVTCKFDARDRKFECTDRVGAKTTWRYDQNDNLLELADGDNQSPYKPTVYTYDVRNLQTSIAYPGHSGALGSATYDKETFDYDAAGRMFRKTDQLGETCTRNWDMANRLESRDYRTGANSPAGTIADTDDFTYDDASRMIEADSGRYSNTVNFTHDDVGRVTAESLTVASQTYTVASAYDAANRRTKLTYPDGSSVIRDYTDRNQLENVKYDADGAGLLPPLLVDHRTYDLGMRMITRTMGNGKVETRTYRNDNLTQTISTPGIMSFAYDYDANKNKLRETIASVTAPAMAQYGFGTVTPVVYDEEDRLKEWRRDDGNKTQSWALSKVGDWDGFIESGGGFPTIQTRSHDEVHQLNSIGSNPLSYDAKGNLTDHANGQTYSWDFDNQLSQAVVPSGAPGNVGTHEYTYDALGRRVSKAVGGTSPQTTVFVCSGQQVIAEYISGAAAAGAQRKYVHASYIDERCLMIDRTALGVLGAGTEEVFYYHTNHLYSVAALTNAAGAPVERYAYDAYGNLLFLDAAGIPLATQTSTLANPHTYTGQRFDEETGNYFYKARYYSSSLGRFINRDPIAYDDGLNMYGYVGGAPTGYVDPSGLRTWGQWISEYNPGAIAGRWLMDDYMLWAEETTRLADGHYEVETVGENGCIKIMIGFGVERERIGWAPNSASWRLEGEIWSTSVYNAHEITAADVDEIREFLEDKAKSAAAQAAANVLIGWMEFFADMAPCGQFLREGILENKVTASGTLWCGFDILTAGFGAKIVGAGGKLVAGAVKGIGKHGDTAIRVMCRACNCFEEGTLVLGPNRDREIQSIQVGQRVLTHARQKRSGKSSAGSSGDRGSAEDDDPDDADDLTIQPENWRKITLVMRRPGGAHSEITLLRPVVWLIEVDAHIGGRIWLDMPEMSCRGWARVVTVGPCPEIEQGGGRIVTATFAHSHGEVWDLCVTGQDEPIGVTATHPIWSEDRQAFVPAISLEHGERLRTLEGLCHVTGISSRGPPERVYNLEVSVDHTYLVAETGVLVHNSSVCRVVEMIPRTLFRVTDDAIETIDDAGRFVRQGGDVLAENKETARAIAEAAGDGRSPFWEAPHNPGELPHYHVHGRVGGHVYYGRSP